MSTPAGAVIFSDLLLGAVVAASHKCRAKRYLSFIANIEDMDIEAEVVEMKQMLVDISRKIDDVLDESMTATLMKLSEESISSEFNRMFFSNLDGLFEHLNLLLSGFGISEIF
jgi:hypothetical protein